MMARTIVVLPQVVDWLAPVWQETAVVPTTGPYVMSDVKKGKSVTFSKQKEWWAKDDRYNQHRFNLDTIKVQVIRDHNIAFRVFYSVAGRA